MDSDSVVWPLTLALSSFGGLVFGWVAAYIGEKRAKFMQLLPLACGLGFMAGVGSAFMIATLLGEKAHFDKFEVLPLALVSAVAAMFVASIAVGIGHHVRNLKR